MKHVKIKLMLSQLFDSHIVDKKNDFESELWFNQNVFGLLLIL